MNNENNNQNQNNNNIDDILDILQKRKLQDLKDGKASNDFPTRIDNAPVGKATPQPRPEASAGNTPAKPATPNEFSSTTPNIPICKVNKPSSPSDGTNRPVANHNSQSAPQNNLSPMGEKKVPASALKNAGSPVANKGNISPVNSDKPKSGNVSSSPVRNNTPKPISLSDFDDKEVERAAQKALRKKKKKARGVPGWVKLIIYLVSVIAVSILISATVINVANDVFAFVKSDEDITISVEENEILGEIATELKEAGIIKYPWIFEKYAKFRISKRSYLTEDFIVGEHTLNPTMNYDKIIAALCVSAYDKSVVKVTIPEGYTFDNILDLFIENGIMKEEDKEEYLKQLQEFPYEYDFITKLTEQGSFDNKDRIHRLEGYLFPDTYEFYKNENPVAALDKLFDNFENKFKEEMYTRAEELGMTVDEIITLASMIEAEGDSPVNFAKISSVFHNRLKDNSGSFRLLGSDATTLYALRISGHDKKTLNADDTDFVHPYNTYTSIGLPPGPICNPGIEAITAALYPETTNYMYFLTMSNGETVFARTAAEHNNNIAKSNRLAAEQKAAQ